MVQFQLENTSFLSPFCMSQQPLIGLIINNHSVVLIGNHYLFSGRNGYGMALAMFEPARFCCIFGATLNLSLITQEIHYEGGYEITNYLSLLCTLCSIYILIVSHRFPKHLIACLSTLLNCRFLRINDSTSLILLSVLQRKRCLICAQLFE